MAVPRIEERSLYPPLVKYLEDLGFKAVGETKVTRKHPDIYFKTDSISFVIEVKIGKSDTGLKAVAQAYDYGRRLGTQNIIILVYPEKIKNQPIADPKIVTKIALEEKVQALVLTEYWTESLIIEPTKLFQSLKRLISIKERKVDFKTIVKLIEGYVRDLNSIVYQIKTEELISEVVDKLDLFSSIGEIKDKETAKKQVINLASYLLFNQLLFYHIYKKKTQDNSLPELEEIRSVKDLQIYFDKITKIDYQSIYRVNILGHIPDTKIVVDTLNEVIKAIKLLRAEHITHDLAGRFFHDLIPFEVRKVLAAFYTHPVAAEILVGLTIDSWDETVIDPACGSGTLLVAAYRRKQELYQKLYGYKDLKKMHKKFIENDLTGIDIMPFAAHISAINLTMQNIEQKTNTIRIATMDSLELVELLKSSEFKRKGIKISPYTTSIQLTLHEAFGTPKRVKKKGAVSPEGKGSEFYLKPVDVVIMNPPFSDREKMPPEMREKLKKNPLGEICGHQINLWGYFLALADLLLKPGGKIGAVIPINIARGKATEKIRKFLLENYHIKYIVKPVGDIAFSEGAAFRDVLLIAEKRKPKKDDVTKIVFLKKSIKELSVEEADIIVDNIITKHKEINESYEMLSIPSSELLKHKNNLMFLIGTSRIDSLEVFQKFYTMLKQSKKLRRLEEKYLQFGFQTTPGGISQIVFITNPTYGTDRIKRALLILKRKNNMRLLCEIQSTKEEITIPLSIIKPALRSVTNVNKFDISDKEDLIIMNEFKGSKKIITLSKWKEKEFDWNIVKKRISKSLFNLCIVRRFNPYSNNTHLLAFYSNHKFVPSDAFIGIKEENTDFCKILNLYFNSIVYLISFFLNKKESTGSFAEIMKEDLTELEMIDPSKLTNSEKQTLLNLFEKLKDVEFPSILEQLENRFWARVELDKTILKILGFSEKEINKWLPKVYDALVEELKAMKNVR